MSASPVSRFRLWWVSGILLLLQAACGGGDGIGSGGTGIIARTALINGTVSMGPVSNAVVVAYALNDGQRGPQIGSTVTDNEGNFSMAIGSWRGPLLIEASAGTYRDAATGSLMTIAYADALTAAVSSPATFGPGPSEIQVTPVTSMARARAQQMAGGMTEANITAANAAIGGYFSVSDILHVPPMNPMVAGAVNGASPDSRNYGMTLAALSQYALSLGMTNSSGLVTAMASDASDGILDGRKQGETIRITVGGIVGVTPMPANSGSDELAAAMRRFASSTANVSGATEDDIAELAQRIGSSDGKF